MRYTFFEEDYMNTVGEGYSAYSSPFIMFVDF